MVTKGKDDARLLERTRDAAPDMLKLIKSQIGDLCGCEEVSGIHGDLEQHQCGWCEILVRVEGGL